MPSSAHHGDGGCSTRSACGPPHGRSTSPPDSSAPARVATHERNGPLGCVPASGGPFRVSPLRPWAEGGSSRPNSPTLVRITTSRGWFPWLSSRVWGTRPCLASSLAHRLKCYVRPPRSRTVCSSKSSAHWNGPQLNANVSVIALPPANLPFSGKTSADQDRVVPSHVPTSKNPKNPTIVKRPTSCRASPNTSMKSALVHV